MRKWESTGRQDDCAWRSAEALKRDGFEVEAETEFRNAEKLLEQAET